MTGIAASIYLCLIAILYTQQEKLLFPGKPLPEEHSFSFELPFKDMSIAVEGATLNALHFTQENPKGLVFFLHGNAGNLQTWTSGVDFYKQVNYDLFILDYRGYGKSSGQIASQQQLFNDVKIAWDFIAPEYEGKAVVLYGRSLGTGLATQLATQIDASLLVLVSPYKSIESLALKQYPVIPKSILKYPIRTDLILPNVDEPVVFFHGDKDSLIPIEHSYALKALTQKPSRLFTIEGAGHGDVHDFDFYYQKFAEVLP